MSFEPQTFSEFVGQQHIIRELVANIRMNSDQDILLRGNYGLGKTTLAKLYAKFRPGDWSYQPVPRYLENLDPSISTHIIDEIHLANEFEHLYESMNDHVMVFCTTERESLPAPFVSRCLELILEAYSEEELRRILTLASYRERIQIDPDSIKIIASRSKGTPRTALQLMERIHIINASEGRELNPRITSYTLNDLRVYEEGLTEDDFQYLFILGSANGPVSLATLSASLNRSRTYVQENLESYLLRQRFVLVTPRGRILTTAGEDVLLKHKEETWGIQR